MNKTPSGPTPSWSDPDYSVQPLRPRPEAALPDPTPDTPALPDPRRRPTHGDPPMPTVIDNIASRPLFKVRSWIFALLTILSWAGSYFGLPGLDIVAWAGPDAIMTIGDLLTGLFTLATAYFTGPGRQPGAVEGVFTSPAVQTVTTLTQVATDKGSAS